MGINLRPVPPPITAPMTDANGIVTTVWSNWFNNVYRFQQAMDDAKADGTYTLGLGTTDGTITMVNGVITAVQEVVL